MQTWLPASQAIAAGQGDELVLDAMDSILAGAPEVVPAWGSVTAPSAATVTGSTRVVCVLGGRNDMQLPVAGKVVRSTLAPGACVVVSRSAWNLPLHRHAHQFLTVDIGRQRIRYYRWRSHGPNRLNAEHTASFVLRPPTETTVRTAAALEAALPVADLGEVRSQLLRALLSLCRNELAHATKVGDTSWLQLSEWLGERLHRPVTRTEAAAVIGVHPNHLSRLVARHAGVGFSAWLSARRIELAQELLLASGASASAVAARSGFASPAYFNRVFRRSTGESPGRWRAAQRLLER